MNLGLLLSGAKLASDVFSSGKNIKNSKKVANEQLKTSEKYYQYNKKQLQDYYEKTYSDNMTAYINDKNKTTEEYNDVNTKLNIAASIEGINLSDSSFANDVQDKLDNEFTINLQNMYTNTINRASELAINKGSMELQLSNRKQDEYNSITDVKNRVELAMTEKVFGSMLNLGVKAYDDYSSFTEKKQDNTFSKYLSSFKFGGV